MATDLRYEAQVSYRMDAIAEMRGLLNDPELLTYYDELRGLAERAVADEQAGRVVNQTWLVIPFHGLGGWTYRAEMPGTPGVRHWCAHRVSAPSRVLAQAAAVEAHRAGQGCDELWEAKGTDNHEEV